MPRGLATKTLNLVAITYEILKAEQPLTVRGVCYRLFNRKLIPDMSKNSTARVSTVLTTARERGLIPWEWIVDETRKISTYASWEHPDEFIDEKIREYRRDRWENQPERVFIVSEKGTVSGILRQVIAHFGVPWVVFHGFGSASALNLLAEISASDDRPLTLLYVGDHDPSGRHMSDVDIPDRLARYGGRATIERVAIDKSDLRGLAPMTFPASDKKDDARYPWFVQTHGTVCCELDALDANVLRERVNRAITRHIDGTLWHRAASVEQAEINSLRDFFATWKREVA
jgi:hypothetical protein